MDACVSAIGPRHKILYQLQKRLIILYLWSTSGISLISGIAVGPCPCIMWLGCCWMYYFEYEMLTWLQQETGMTKTCCSYEFLIFIQFLAIFMVPAPALCSFGVPIFHLFVCLSVSKSTHSVNPCSRAQCSVRCSYLICNTIDLEHQYWKRDYGLWPWPLSWQAWHLPRRLSHFIHTDTVMFLSFRMDRSGQTVQTQIRLLLEEESDQGLHCLPFCLHLLTQSFLVSEFLGFLLYYC